MSEERKLEFWNTRGAEAKNPGTNDFILKKLELDIILREVPAGSRVVDVGCGDGETLVTLAERNDCTGIGIDFAGQMIDAARRRSASAGTNGTLQFLEGALPELPAGLGLFDYVITERCLINLAAEQQHAGFRALIRHARPGGRYLMIESFIQGLERSNALRLGLGLEPITPPWHNAFLDESVVSGWEEPGVRLRERVPFTSTYHFLSRVVYARLARDRGEELKYDSDINLLSLKLPAIGNYGPVCLWSWERAEGATG